MTTPNIWALMGRLEEILQNHRRYLALRREGLIVGDERQLSRVLDEATDEYADKLIEQQGEQADE